MKKLLSSILTISVLVGATGCSKSNTEADQDNGEEVILEGGVSLKVKPETQQNYSEEEKLLGDSMSYLLGCLVARDYKQITQRQAAMANPQLFDSIKFMKGIHSVIYADTTDNLSYVQGQYLALQNIIPLIIQMRDKAPFDADMLMKGLKTTMENYNKDNKYQSEFMKVQRKVDAIGTQKASKRSAYQKEANGKAGEAFIEAEKKNHPEIQTSETGLSYWIKNPGGEIKVAKNDRIKLNYKGYTIDGNVFDQTNGKAVEINAGGFIPGFLEGLTMLGEGGDAVLYIPGNLAYGDNGVPQIGIGPNTTLIFEIQVEEIVGDK